MDVAKEEEINKENNGFNPVIQKEEQYNKDVINQNHFYNQNSTPSRQIPQIVDEPSGGMCFLCLLFPAIGLIVGLSCQYQKPKTSNEYLKYTAIGVGLFIGLSILLALLNFIVSKL